MSKTTILLLGLVLALVAFYGTAHFTASARGVPPRTPELSVPGAPGAVYDAILPELRDRIARETKIVRVDDSSGMMLRFSAYLEDHSVRLVEIRLAATGPDATMATVGSRRFSILPGRSRDASDAALEASIAALIRRRTSPPVPQPGPRAPGG